MTSDLQTDINGNRVTRLDVRFPWSGVWSAEADFDQALPDDQLVGPAVIHLGPLTLKGFFDPELTGTFQTQSKCHLHGGVNGWPAVLPAAPYHSDAGVLATTVLTDLARETGETLGDLSAVAGLIVGNDFVRARQRASATLSWLLGQDVQWFVDESGITQIVDRPALEINGDYEVLEYDSRFKVAKVTSDDPGIIGVGSVLRGPKLARPLWVKEVAITVDKSGVRFTCWGVEVAI